MNIGRVLSLLSKDQDELDETPSQIIAEAEAFVYDMLLYALDNPAAGADWYVIPNLLAMHGFFYDQYNRHIGGDVTDLNTGWEEFDEDEEDEPLNIFGDDDDEDEDDAPLDILGDDDDDDDDEEEEPSVLGAGVFEGNRMPLASAEPEVDRGDEVPAVGLGQPEPTGEIPAQKLGETS